MSGVAWSPLAEQAERLHALHRHLAEGLLLKPLLVLAQSGRVWQGPISEAFLAWSQFALDRWVRNDLAEGVRLVAQSLTDRVAAIEAARAAGLSGPAAPTRIGYTFGPPPAYGNIGGGDANRFIVEGMRDLSRLLGSTADHDVMARARELEELLVPPSMPVVPGALPPVNPFPPDAEAVTGYPNTWRALAQELRNGAADVAARADKVALAQAPMETAKLDTSLWDKLKETAVAGGKSRACWLSDGEKDPEEYERDIGGPLSRLAASASHDPKFTPEFAERLFSRGGSGWGLLSDGAYSTDVTLMVADKLINDSDTKTMADEHRGLEVLLRNPEAAHLFAAENGEVLTELAGKPRGSEYDPWSPEVPALAGEVLRVGLVEYPASVAAFTPGESTAEELFARAAAAKAAADTALVAATAVVNAVADGKKLGPEGRLALAEYFAANIEVVAAAGNAGEGQITDLAILPDDLAESFKQIMKDPEARAVLLAGANEAVAGWAGGFASAVGDGLDAGGDLFTLIQQKASITVIEGGAKDLGTLLGQLGAAVRANVKDQKKAAAEMVGVMSFLLSQGLGVAATAAGAWPSMPRG